MTNPYQDISDSLSQMRATPPTISSIKSDIANRIRYLEDQLAMIDKWQRELTELRKLHAAYLEGK